MSSIFISHGGPDLKFAERLCDALTAAGFHAFLFSRHAQPGKKLHHLMRDEISARDRVVLVCSEASLNRLGVRNEIEEALAKEARLGGASSIIPVTLDDYGFTRWHPAVRQPLESRRRLRVLRQHRDTALEVFR